MIIYLKNKNYLCYNVIKYNKIQNLGGANLSYKETKNRGTFDFPVEIYYLDENHPRYVMDHHWHFEHEIIRILEGKLAVTLHQTKYTAKRRHYFCKQLHTAMPYRKLCL